MDNKMKKIFLLAILLLSFSSSSLLAVLGTEMATFIGYYPSGTNMNGIPAGIDFCFCTREHKISKLKSVKEKLGWRVSCCGVKRKNDELKNNKVEGTSIKFITSSESGINEKFLFDIKGPYCLGIYTRSEYTNSKEEYLATSIML
jgi:hypothetical protein